MADQHKYILRAAGPATKLSALQPDSVRLQELAGGVPLASGRLTPHTWIQLSHNYKMQWTQAYCNYGVLPTQVESFLFHWSPWADTGLLADTGKSVSMTVGITPISCSAGVSASGEPTPATTNIEAVVLSAIPTWGTTAGTPPTTDHQFMLGPSEFNGAAINNLVRQTVNFGIACDWHLGKSGSQYPAWPPAVTAYTPEIVFETEDLSIVSPYVHSPAALSSSAAAVKFQNETGSAGYVYTMSAAMVYGSIQNDIGTLRLRMTDGATWTPAAY